LCSDNSYDTCGVLSWCNARMAKRLDFTAFLRI
jgi:hypothetical protein